MHQYSFLADKIKENYMFSKPSKFMVAAGLLLLFICMMVYYREMRLKLQSYLGDQISIIFVFIFLVLQFIPHYALIAGYVFTLTRIKVWRLEIL